MRPTAAFLYLALVGFAVFSFTVKNELRMLAGEHRAGVKLNAPAPPIVLPDRMGRSVDLAEVSRKNRLVMVNFWATWCAPCRLEMPQFEKIYEQKKSEGFEILAVSVDKEPEKLDAYLAKRSFSFPILHDSTGITAERYGISAFPTTIFVNREGTVIQVMEGMQKHIEWQVEHRLTEAKKAEGAKKND